MHIYDLIRATIQVSDIWPRIASGRVNRMCKEFSRKAATDLAPINGLSILQVVSCLGIDHSWLVAHHESVGYFWIDVTAGEPLSEAGKEYNDGFIGTPDEFAELAKKHDLENTHLIWTPALSYRRPTPLTTEEISFWSKYPYGEIDFMNREKSDNRIWAAMVFSDREHNWRDVIISSTLENAGYNLREVAPSQRAFMVRILMFSKIEDGIASLQASPRPANISR